MKENSVITNASVDNNIYSTMVTMDAELGLFKAVSKKKIIEKTPINNSLKKKIQVISNNKRNFEGSMIVKKINESGKNDTYTEFMSQNSIISDLK